MLDILDILEILHLENKLTDEEIMEIAGIKGKDTYARWWQGTKPSGKAYGKLFIAARKLLPVEKVCPYGIPTEEMFRHALELRLKDILDRYPEIYRSRHHWKSEHEDKNCRYKHITMEEWNDWFKLNVHKERLIKKKHYYELGWTDTKSWCNSHYEITKEEKLEIVSKYHDDENIRNHFMKIYEQV